MSYEHIEQIRDRADEKVALFLTAHNMLGLVIGAMPTYLLTQQMPFLVRAALILGLGTLGVIATLDVGGLPLYARLLWRIRGVLRTRSEGRRVSAEVLQGATATEHALAMPMGGLVLVVGTDVGDVVADPLSQRARHLGRDMSAGASNKTANPEPAQPNAADGERGADADS